MTSASCLCFRVIVGVAEVVFSVSALVVALMASARIGLRLGYGQYFAGSGDDLYDVRESDRLKRLALVLGVSGYWVYIAVAISVGVGLGISSYSSSSKCLPHTWLLTAVMLLVSLFAVSVNITSLIFAVDATNSFNTVAPKVMIDSLRHSCNNVSLADIPQTRHRQAAEENKTESSVDVLWDELQTQRQCCGHESVLDYDNCAWNGSVENRSQALAPLTCCRRVSYPSNSNLLLPFCEKNGTDLADYYTEGCLSVLRSSSNTDKELAMMLSCFVILMVVTSIVLVCVECRIDDDDDDDDDD